ncbi:Na/Pi symporter [Limibacter armeniacum]|uniref:Na/Pi symporter n=1 Tax=Limibacter armeniacum TaxID=466084 RepID=UPI002FE53573
MTLTQLKNKGGDKTWYNTLTRVLSIMAAFILFLVAFELMTMAIGALGKDYTRNLITATSNPFIALFIGMLVTAIVQSSSTVTAVVVAMAGTGTINYTDAVPIIMGANIGTTITSTLVSLGYIGSKNMFRKAIAAASLHDFFNLFTALVLFPLEYLTKSLSGLSETIANNIFPNMGNNTTINVHHVDFVSSIFKYFGINPANYLWPIGILSVVLLLLALKAISSLSKKWLQSKRERENLELFFFNTPVKSLVSGLLLTASVQSSSLTSSLIVPLVATNKVTLPKAFNFLIGANVGTTVTALIAALSTNSHAAIVIAIAHLLFNIFGLLLFITPLSRLPQWYATTLSNLVSQNRIFGFYYLLAFYFVIPFLLILIDKVL